MYPSTVYAKFPAGWHERIGDTALTEKGEELLNSEIIKRLPECLTWCGDELLIDCHMEGGQIVYHDDSIPEGWSLDEAIDEAIDVVFASDEPGIWEED